MMSEETVKYGQKRDGKGRFKKGNPGKPKGAKAQITKDLKTIFLNVLERSGGEDWLFEWVHSNNRNKTTFIQIIARMLPQNVDANVAGDLGLTIKRIISDKRDAK